MRTVLVRSGNYAVVIGPGLLSEAGERIRQATKSGHAIIVTDERVGPLYAGTLKKSLAAAGIAAEMFTFAGGEGQKTLETFARAVTFFAEHRLTRDGLVIALGGGVVGDLAGFAAAAYMRGVDCVQIPTTLLAAVDASVGGKTGVDLPQGKNLVGAFHQPRLVLCDTEIIARLPEPLLRDGAGEMLKCGVLCDEALFSRMADGSWRAELEEAICRCVSIKRDYVDADEFDNGARQFLNLGHTFGHAVETCSNFTISHGRCVAIGMAMAFRAAGLDAGEVVRASEACGLATACPYTAGELLAAVALDKKNRDGSVTLVLPERIGKCALRSVSMEEMREYIQRGLGESACA